MRILYGVQPTKYKNKYLVKCGCTHFNPNKETIIDAINRRINNSYLNPFEIGKPKIPEFSFKTGISLSDDFKSDENQPDLAFHRFLVEKKGIKRYSKTKEFFVIPGGKKQIEELFNEYINSVDINYELDCKRKKEFIENNKNVRSIPTDLTKKIIKNIKEIDKNIFKNKNTKICLFSACEYTIYKILKKEFDKGLKKQIQNNQERINYINNNILYIVCINEQDYNNIIEKDSNIKNIELIKNIDEYKVNKKFNWLIANPPFDGSLHLDFLKKFLEISDKIINIEPGQWLVQLKEGAKYTKNGSISDNIKKQIEGHIKKVELNNMNPIFNIENKTVCSIIYINQIKNYNKIDLEVCGEKREVESIYDCNLIGNIKEIQSILNKCKNYKDHMINHCIDLKKYKEYEDKGYYFLRYSNYMINNLGTMMTHKWTNAFHIKTKNIDTLSCMFEVLANRKDIENKIYTSKKGNPCDCVYGTKEELENWKYFVYNNKLPLFINICLTIDEHNNSRNYAPWLVDKKYTDEEIYKLLNITKKEQELIDKTIKNFDKDSDFGKELFKLGNWKNIIGKKYNLY